ncbi:MAG: hypothetical protein PVF34_06685 [Gammaproteobacteria bacterium]|jgi:hypothetical protein
MSSESIKERRRVVYSALAHHLKQERLLEALWLWEQKYALTSGLELRKFVSEIILKEDDPELKSKVYKSLTKATYFSEDIELLPDPYDAMQKYREQCNGTFKYISPFDNQLSIPFSTAVFQKILETLFVKIKHENSIVYEYFSRLLKTKLIELQLEANRKQEITDWLDKKTDTLRLAYSETFMSKLLNEIYQFCCDQFGPMTSDKILAEAIKEADSLEAARFYNPKQLL